MDDWHKGLTTEKQRRFCEAYAANGGNATDAARQAGYSKPDPQGAEVLGNLRVQEAIERLRLEATNKSIADRTERQSFWSAVLRDNEELMPHRLKASELLGRSHGDFLDRHEVAVTTPIRYEVTRTVVETDKADD